MVGWMWMYNADVSLPANERCRTGSKMDYGWLNDGWIIDGYMDDRWMDEVYVDGDRQTNTSIDR